MGSLEVVIRRIKPNSLVRIYTGWKAGAFFFVSLASVGGFVLALFAPQKLNLSVIVLIILGSILLGVIVAFFRGKQKLIPDMIIDEFSSEKNYSVKFCTIEGLREADEMTKPIFGGEFIPFDRIEQWRLKNPKGFVQINNNDGLLCACFVILGLQRSFFDQFMAGRVTEHEIDSDVVLSFDDMKKENQIYISGVVVRDPGGHLGSKRANIMLWAMLEYIKRVFGLRKTRTFYAVALTKQSEKLLKKMGFKISCNKKSRKDNRNLYSIDLDKKTWEELLTRIANYSKMVSFHIDL